MFVFDLSSSVCNKTIYQTWQKRFIKLDESDSSNLTKKRYLIKSDEKTSSHQIWRKNVILSNLTKERHFIKSDESVILSNFLRRKTISLLFDEQSLSQTVQKQNCEITWCDYSHVIWLRWLCIERNNFDLSISTYIKNRSS